MIGHTHNDPILRDAFRISFTIEKFLEVCMLNHFYNHGSLAAPSLFSDFCTDEEYLCKF